MLFMTFSRKYFTMWWKCCCPKKNVYLHFCQILFFWNIWTWQFTLRVNFMMNEPIERLQIILEQNLFTLTHTKMKRFFVLSCKITIFEIFLFLRTAMKSSASKSDYASKEKWDITSKSFPLCEHLSCMSWVTCHLT